MVILVDLDGVALDFLGSFLPRFYETNPTAPQYTADQITEFYMENLYGEEWRDQIYEIMMAEGFYRSLRPIAGAVEGIQTLQDQGHNVVICTAPMPSPWCAQEKFESVVEHFGQDLATRMIITKDKTLIRGDWLIDDKPEIPGLMTPVWKHAVFDAPYNRQITREHYRVSWNGMHLERFGPIGPS